MDSSDDEIDESVFEQADRLVEEKKRSGATLQPAGGVSSPPAGNIPLGVPTALAGAQTGSSFRPVGLQPQPPPWSSYVNAAPDQSSGWWDIWAGRRLSFLLLPTSMLVQVCCWRHCLQDLDMLTTALHLGQLLPMVVAQVTRMYQHSHPAGQVWEQQLTADQHLEPPHSAPKHLSNSNSPAGRRLCLLRPGYSKASSN
jgi:hypothetical protein